MGMADSEGKQDYRWMTWDNIPLTCRNEKLLDLVALTQ